MRSALSYFLFTARAGSFLPHFSNSRVFACYLLLLITLFAAMASGQTCPDGDVNGDCIVDVNDLMIVAGDWLEPGTIPANIDGLGNVDWEDFAILSADWGKNEQTGSLEVIIDDPKPAGAQW